MTTPSIDVDVIIAGAGLSGLSVAHFLKKLRPDLSLLLLEKTDRVGGAIQSMNSDGFLAEWGAHGFLDNVAENRELLEDLDLGDSLQKAPLKHFVRYICWKGKLIRIPQSPPEILKTKLLSFPQKLRVLGDFWKKPLTEEQTIAQWAQHRFGKAMLPFADIALTGTYAGDIESLSIDAAMPGLRRLEQTFGSVFKGALKSRKKKASASGMPSMISFKGGMETLVKRMAEGFAIRCGAQVDEIARESGRWHVKTGKQFLRATSLVIALPINGALELLKSLQPPPIDSVREAIVNNVVMGFKEPAHVPFGFGYLAPKSENRFALGSLFSSHMFPERAPQGYSQIEILVGGMRHPGHSALEDAQLIERAFQDVKQLIDLPEKPAFSTVIRPHSGIPQLETGYHRLLSYRENLQRLYARLQVCGFGWEGIGINDMIKQAKRVAEAIARDEAVRQEPAPAKPIYF